MTKIGNENVGQSFPEIPHGAVSAGKARWEGKIGVKGVKPQAGSSRVPTPKIEVEVERASSRAPKKLRERSVKQEQSAAPSSASTGEESVAASSGGRSSGIENAPDSPTTAMVARVKRRRSPIGRRREAKVVRGAFQDLKGAVELYAREYDKNEKSLARVNQELSQARDRGDQTRVHALTVQVQRYQEGSETAFRNLLSAKSDLANATNQLEGKKGGAWMRRYDEVIQLNRAVLLDMQGISSRNLNRLDEFIESRKTPAERENDFFASANVLYVGAFSTDRLKEAADPVQIAALNRTLDRIIQSGFKPENHAEYARLQATINYYAESITTNFVPFKDVDPNSEQGADLKGLANNLIDQANDLLVALDQIPVDMTTDRVLYMHVEQLKASIGNHVRLLRDYA
jgi:hypothetical protein